MQVEGVVDYIVNWLKEYAQSAGVNGFVGKDGVTKVCALFCCQFFQLERVAFLTQRVEIHGASKIVPDFTQPKSRR